MTPRERWLAVLDGATPDRVPTDYRATPEVTRRLLRDLGCADEAALCRRLNIDKMIYVGPRYVGPDLGERDTWGLSHVTIEYGYGLGSYSEVVEHPLADAMRAEQFDDYAWPSPDWYDYSGIRAAAERHAAYPIFAGGYEPFLVYCHLRGQERAMMDLADAPELVDAGLGHIFAFHFERNRRIFESAGAGAVHVTDVSDDLGTQQSLLMSEATVDRFLKPHMRRMIELAHAFGIRVMHHSDGAIRPLLAGMIDIGIDILDPVQWRCAGMDRRGLMDDFGDRLVFHGGVCNQQTLPFGTPDDVRVEVRENIAIFGRRYICGPCHNIQPNTSTEKIVALYETAQEAGGFA